MDGMYLNKDSLYVAKGGVGFWYRIPTHRVTTCLKTGASVRELPPGGTWRTLSYTDFKNFG